jgi:hypothetical protein
MQPGLPDFSRHNIPKRRKIYQIVTKLPNGHNICKPNRRNKFQMAIECTNLSIPRPSKIYPIGIFGLKIYHLASLDAASRYLHDLLQILQDLLTV